jgi:Transglycosylase SLT domain
MEIHFKNSIDHPGFCPTAGSQKKGAIEQSSFMEFLKKVSDSPELQETVSEDSQSGSMAQNALALCQRMQLQMNESLLRILSDTQEGTPGENSLMDDPMALFAKGSNVESYLSTIGQHPSKMPLPQIQEPGTAQAPSEKINDRPAVHDIDSIIRQAATAYGVNRELIKGVIQAESDFDPNAISPKGAAGLMQLMPETAKELGVTDPFNPTENIMGGTRYLKQLLDHYDGNVPLALAAYNWGIGNMDSNRSKMPAETRNYVAKITGIALT